MLMKLETIENVNKTVQPLIHLWRTRISFIYMAECSAHYGAFLAQEVYVCGLVTEVCVRAAALDAARERFATYLVADASGALEKSPGDEARVHDELRAAGVKTVTTADVLAGRPEAS